MLLPSSCGRMFSEARPLPVPGWVILLVPDMLSTVFSLRSLLRHGFSGLLLRSPRAEPSRLIVGSTGSGKSEGELVDLIRLAERGDHAVVLLDGHGPLALQAAGHWGARGHESRLIYEPLHATERALCWNMLQRSLSPSLSQRRIEDEEIRDEVAQCFLAQRNLGTLNDKPWTKEWLEAAIGLCLAQPESEPLGSLLSCFRIGSADYERLLRHGDRSELVEKFRDMEQLRRRNAVQYEAQTGASRRLLEAVCGSEVVRLRSRPGPFDWLSALRQRRLIAFDGGGLRSKELKRTLFLLASMQVIHAVRRHFAAIRKPLPVVLVLEEAGALGLVTPFILAALQELRKAGLACHIISQASVDFGNPDLFESILANTPWQCWYQTLSPADQELGAKVLTNATFDALSVHYTRTRPLPDGVERVETVSHGESFDAKHHPIQHDRRTGTALRTTYQHLVEASYKTPQLVEQEFRTKLATLRIGERLVRDRSGVRCERVVPARLPWLRPITDASTRALIERLRQDPLYQTCSSPETVSGVRALPDAAARLRSLRRE